MDPKESQSDIVTLKELLSIFGLPTLPELMREGLNPGADTYKGVVIRLIRSYLETVKLDLEPLENEEYRLLTTSEEGWQDAAYWLGHMVNLGEGKVVYQSPEDLLNLGAAQGEKHLDHKAAVMANLNLLGEIPLAFSMGLPDKTLRHVLEEVRKAEMARSLA